MANKVSIFIKNTEGNFIELTNSKMALMLASDNPQYNWKNIFGYEIGKYDIILSDFSNSYGSTFGLGYYLVQKCDDENLARNIIRDCKKLIKGQYERMMMIRVAKKYKLDEKRLLKLQLEYNEPKNFEIDLNEYFNRDIN